MAIKTVVQIIELRELTIRVLSNQYAISNEADGKSYSTVKWYNEILTSFSGYLKNKLHNNGISLFNLEVIRGYILYLRKKPCFEGHPYTPQQDRTISVRTIQCHVRALKAFSTWLYSNGYTFENRLKNLRIPKAPVTFVEPLTPEEIRKITASINKQSPTGNRNYALFVTLLDTGLRASEAASIILNNLNLTDGYIKVMGKGSKERIVPIGKYVQRTLWVYIDKVRRDTSSIDCDNLFLTRNGIPITVNTVKLVFSRLAKSSGVKRLHAHLCRHTFAINYLLNGGDIFSLREILGHTTLEIVNHYLHFTSSQITMQHHKFSPIDRFQEQEKDHNRNRIEKGISAIKIGTAPKFRIGS